MADGGGTSSDFSEESMTFIEQALAERKYVLKEQIGMGGFSIVFRVHSTQYQSDFAAKVTNIASTRRRDASTSVENEGSALSKLNHPQILKLYDSFTVGNFSFLILEYCRNGPLKDIIKQRGLPEAAAIRMMRLLAEGLMYMHLRGFVHRDIKPSNVLIDEHWRPKFADFGICQQVRPGDYITDFSGSPQYRSPEIVRKVPFDPYKADIWALGVTFFEISNGLIKWPPSKQLVEATIVSVGIAIAPRTPRAIAKMVKAMTAMEPEARPRIDKIAGSDLFREPEKQVHSSRSAVGGDQVWPDGSSLTAREFQQLTERLRVNSSMVIPPGQRKYVAHASVTGKPPVMTEVKALLPVPNTNRLVAPTTWKRRNFGMVMVPTLRRSSLS